MKNGGTAGVILLQVLVTLAALNFLSFVVFIVAFRLSQINTLMELHRHSYWLARSEAMALITEMNQGIQPHLPLIRSVPGGSISVSSTNAASILQVVVQSTWNGGVDCLHFSYNTTTHHVTDWLDNYSKS